MHNTHITKKHKAHSAREKASFGLLTVFFMLLLWGGNPSVKAANYAGMVLLDINGQHEKEAHVQSHQKQNKEKAHLNVAKEKNKLQQFIEWTYKSWNRLQGHEKGLVLVASGLAVLAGTIAWNKRYRSNPVASTSSSSPLNKETSVLQGPQEMRTEIRYDSKQAFESMASDTGNGTMGSFDNLAGGLRHVWNTAIAGLEKVKVEVSVGPTQIDSAPNNVGASVVVEQIAKQGWGAKLYNAVWKVWEFCMVKHPVATRRTACVALCYAVWRRLSWKMSEAVDMVFGWLGGEALQGFLGPLTSGIFGVFSGLAACLGKKFSKCIGLHDLIKNKVQELLERWLPGKHKVQSIVDKIVPSFFGKEWVKGKVDEYWGGSSDDSGTKDNKGAAAFIAEGIASLFGYAIGLGVLFFICLKIEKWFKSKFGKFLGWTNLVKSFDPAPVAPPAPPAAQPKPQPQELKQPKQLPAELGKSVWLHIIHSLGLAGLCYSLVDNIIKKLEDKAEHYTRHQRYKSKSKVQEIKEKATSKFTEWQEKLNSIKRKEKKGPSKG